MNIRSAFSRSSSLCSRLGSSAVLVPLPLLCVLLALPTVSSTLLAQTTVKTSVIRGVATCSDCRIELTRVVALGGKSADAGLIRAASSFAVDSRGRYFVGPTEVTGQVHIFDSDGRSIGVLGGRPGRGPGEFERVSAVWVGAGDTVHVFDNTRHSRFSADLKFLDAVSIIWPPRYAHFFSNGRSIQNFSSSTPQRHSNPIHLVAKSGLIIKSFGLTGDDTLYGPTNDSYGRNRPITGSNKGAGFWASRQNHYVLEKWDTTGVLLARYEREAAWFPPWRDQTRRGHPAVMAIREDEEERIWVLLNPASGGTLIEVVDLNSATILASQEFKDIFARQFAGALFASPRELPDGDTVLDVYRAAIRKP